MWHLLKDFPKKLWLWKPHGGTLGCLIPPLLFQTYFSSISFGHLWFQDTQNIILFPDFGGSWGDLRGNFLGNKTMFWVSWNHRWPNETLAELIWDKKRGMTHPRVWWLRLWKGLYDWFDELKMHIISHQTFACSELLAYMFWPFVNHQLWYTIVRFVRR